jgi:hypothetical protein
MKWLDMANLLFEKSNALSPRGAHLHLDTAGWLRTWTPHQNQAADYGARYFARHQEWPQLDAEASCQLYFRCLFAIENCIKYDAQGPRPPSDLDAEQKCLESLLIEDWHRGGIDWAEKRYANAAKPRRVCV